MQFPTAVPRTLPCCFNHCGGCSAVVPRACLSVIPTDICPVVGIPQGARGVLCEMHRKVSSCSVPGCTRAPKAWFDRKQIAMVALTEKHCQILDLDQSLAGQVDQFDGVSTARICTSCRKHVQEMPTEAYRNALYKKNEEHTNKAVYSVEVKADQLDWIQSQPPEHCGFEVKSFFLPKKGRNFVMTSVDGLPVSAASYMQGRRGKGVWEVEGVFTRACARKGGCRGRSCQHATHYRGRYYCAQRLLCAIIGKAERSQADGVTVHAQVPPARPPARPLVFNFGFRSLIVLCSTAG